ncbi:hypothetical protein MJO29_016570 [Puccinia striiformis f. sp. tritici]|nr:hypothetical protein MJO29_016570 [Puccinia striiformis f. sp. tritici]KAI9628526.1 hypothetical protein KEM48_011481 [Puccinia striiformis f. sp. tritici PST-130]
MARKDAGVTGLEAVATGLTSFVKVKKRGWSRPKIRGRFVGRGIATLPSAIEQAFGVQQDRELVHDGFSLSDNHTWHPRLQGSMATEIIVLCGRRIWHRLVNFGTFTAFMKKHDEISGGDRQLTPQLMGL